MFKIRSPRVCAAAVVLLLLAGCAARSISNSGYYADPDHGWRARNAPEYRGELNEFDVIGIKRDTAISETDIRSALDSRQALAVHRGAAVMLVQSGARFADEAMVQAMEKYYTVTSFGGVPNDELGGEPPAAARTSYAMALRLAAARAGCETIVAYWGVLETGHENLATRTISWVPIVGWGIPDQSQRMRIRLKVAVVDVRTGNWEMFAPEPLDDKATSAG